MTEYSDETELAKNFNRCFSQVADILSDHLPHLSNVDPLDYVSCVEPTLYLPSSTQTKLCDHIKKVEGQRDQ